MPIVKIVQKGWETFDGILEGVQFKNGKSVESMSYLSAERIGCSMAVVDAETDKPVSSSQRIIDTREDTAEPGRITQSLIKSEESAENIAKKIEKPKKAEKPKEATKTEMVFEFEREQLEELADNAGISGLREFAKEYNVNGTSIVGIIDALMAKKNEAK